MGKVRFTISKAGDFYEIFDKQKMITAFVTDNKMRCLFVCSKWNSGIFSEEFLKN